MAHITNIRHFLDGDGKMAKTAPREAIEFGSFLALIIDSVTESVHVPENRPEVRCFQPGCNGTVKAFIDEWNHVIRWLCPECGYEGIITEWQGTKWDNR